MSTAPSLETATRPNLGRVGIWSGELRFGDAAAATAAMTQAGEMGFGTIWIPGGFGGDILDAVSRGLDATKKAVIATGIINIWRHEPAEIGDWWRGLGTARQSRVMLGLGVSHGPMIGEYNKPLSKMVEFLDGLDREGLPREHLCIAALAPKMLDLSGERTAGTHPYLVTPEHTAIAHKHVGPKGLVAPEQHVILETDAAKARAMGREALKTYMQLPNYVNSWRRLGFSDADVTEPTDKLVDAIIAWGGIDVIVERVRQHHAAGADHVCVQVVTAEGAMSGPPPVAAWRTLAEALL